MGRWHPQISASCSISEASDHCTASEAVAERRNHDNGDWIDNGREPRVFSGIVRLRPAGAYYLGGQAGWTGLPYQTDTIDRVASVPISFDAGYNLGVRGYGWGSWRFEEKYSYRRNKLPNTATLALMRGSRITVIPTRS
jgi:hypothetical protein